MKKNKTELFDIRQEYGTVLRKHMHSSGTITQNTRTVRVASSMRVEVDE